MLTFRAITDEDKGFLATLYASTREEEMRPVPWPDEEKAKFLFSQFEAQHRFYQEQFKDAKFDLILSGDTPVGRLYLQERDDEFRIIDIALMPDFRGQGIGSGILRDIMNKAQGAGKAVRIHVEKNNPALALYRRLEFDDIEDQGVYLLMEYRAAANG